MRLHHVIEDLAPDYAGQEWFERIRADDSEFAGFDFGDISTIPAAERADLQKYAVELMAHDLFKLPFPGVAFSFREHGMDFLLLLADAATLRIFSERCDCAYQGFMFASPSGCAISLGQGVAIDMGETLARGSIQRYATQNLLDGRLREAFPRDTLNKLLNVAMQSCLALVSLLNAQGVETKLLPAPAKLNAKRAKSGKPAIQDIREVRIRVGGRAYAVSGHSESGHASPRLHWRRGHIRRLPTGKITNVRPCLVGAVCAETPALPSYAISN